MGILFSPIDRASSVDLRDQLCEKISFQITQGLLKPGMRLPSCRKVASQLGVLHADLRRLGGIARTVKRKLPKASNA